MAYRNTTGATLYVNADRSKIVPEDSQDAAFVLVGPNGELSDADAAKYNLRGGEVAQPDPLAEARKAHDDAMARGATEEARSHRNRVADLEAQQDAAKQARRSGREGEAAAPQSQPAEPKAVASAENKGRG